MNKRTIQEPVTNERGDEVHPAFGMVTVNRVSSGGGGVALFDSEITHTHFVTLEITGATRRRDLHRDWVHDDNTPLVKIAMSEAQWAQMVSSLNTSGTPVTLEYTKEDGYLPDLPYAPRMAVQEAETREAAHRLFDSARAALATYKEHKTVKNLRNLEAALTNAEPNLAYAARTMSEHVENVVTKARADVEAMVHAAARNVGIDPSTIKPFELSTAPEEEDLL